MSRNGPSFVARPLDQHFHSGLVTSIVRFITFFRSNSFIDGSFAAIDLAIWAQTETGIYLIFACLMTYRSLLERFASNPVVARMTKISSHQQRPSNNERRVRSTDRSGRTGQQMEILGGCRRDSQ